MPENMTPEDRARFTARIAEARRVNVPTPPPPPRFYVWTVLTHGLWGLLVLGMVASTLADLADLVGGAQRSANGAAYASLWFNVWGLAAAGYLAALKANPFNWINELEWKGGRRLACGLFAIALLIGRPFSTPFNDLLGAMTDYKILSVLGFCFVTPLVMILGFILCVVGLSWLILGAVGFVGFPLSMLFSLFDDVHNKIRVFRYERDGLAGYIHQFGYWLRGEEVPVKTDDSKGSRFASLAEIDALRKADGIGFGHVNNRPLRLKTEKHVLIMASTRSGKGVSLIIPHLLRYPGSAFVLDPKGENARFTGDQREQLNDRVHYLDPFGISGRIKSRFNPLSRFTPDNMEAESKALAAALILGERDHWTASAQQLLAALILYVFVAPEIPPDKKDLPTVRRLLLGSTDTALQAMLTSSAADGLLADLAASFLKTPEKEFGSILSTAQRETEILDNPFIIASLSATGQGEAVDFAAWRNGTMTVYLCLSAPKFPVFSRWLRLVLTSALDEMTDTLQPPRLPVCFMLDELAALGHLPAVENAIGLAAGYGVQLFTVFQDVAQMRDLYKGRWASFVGNAGIRAVFNLDDYDTAHYWSQFIGGHIIETFSRQENLYGVSHGQGRSETFRPLLPPEDIMLHFAADKMLVLPQGSRPIIADRVPYFTDSVMMDRLERLREDRESADRKRQREEFDRQQDEYENQRQEFERQQAAQRAEQEENERRKKEAERRRTILEAQPTPTPVVDAKPPRFKWPRNA